jgi:hypothetical protein
MTYTFDDQVVSDLHKEAYGFRPTTGFWEEWAGSNSDQKQVTWDRLILVAAEEEEWERQAQQKAYKAWVIRIDTMVANGMGNTAEVIREDMESKYVGQDVGYYCYLNNLPYSTEDEIKKLLE